MWRSWFDLLLLVALFHSSCSSDSDQELNLFDEDDLRSRLVMIDGNMYFHAARQKNISFIAGAGGSIYFGEKNLNLLPELTEFEVMKEEMDKTKGRVNQLVRMANLFKRQIKLKSGDVAALNRKVSLYFTLKL
uniref:LAM_G_DOMAIN domain-containing protein n=1 Tax=Elaeophora elaphi TaxID=1147741 RepID=A0A0R3RQE4_9BILA